MVFSSNVLPQVGQEWVICPKRTWPSSYRPQRTRLDNGLNGAGIAIPSNIASIPRLENLNGQLLLVDVGFKLFGIWICLVQRPTYYLNVVNSCPYSHAGLRRCPARSYPWAGLKISRVRRYREHCCRLGALLMRSLKAATHH